MSEKKQIRHQTTIIHGRCTSIPYRLFIIFFWGNSLAIAQKSEIIPQYNDRLLQIAGSASVSQLESDIRTLVNFGTRNTLSDTVSKVRGIGAARRWIKSRFDEISAGCDHCLDVFYQDTVVSATDNARIPQDTRIVNVVAVQRGTLKSNRYIMMSGDIDSRISDATNATDDSPGANDNATGMAGTIEAARILSQYSFPHNIVYLGLSGEEQGLFGGQAMARWAKEQGWQIIGILNNDMIGNIEGIDGSIDNCTFRIFSEPTPVGATEQQRIWHRFYGGEVDGPSRQLARYIDQITRQYMPAMKPIMIYRLDRFGRGGHHRPFNDLGFPGVRIMETHENYDRQHQDLRTENGIQYGDVIEGVNFPYVAKLTAVNALTLGSLASAPSSPDGVMIGGAVSPSTTLRWEAVEEEHLLGYKIYWRDTTSPHWQYERWVGNQTQFTLENVIIDNYLFGVASVAKDGSESVVQFPTTLIPRSR
ncbi:MAG: M28 family metallopeptidase [Saprospiraceae bacterium]|nr:M28 family metallopeptidase [Saprospiraceae bacterium]